MIHLRAAVLAALALLTGCAAESAGISTDTDPVESTSTKAPIFAEKAINVDQSFSDAVQVNDGSLVVPTSMLGKIEIGSILAGDRSTKGNANPYGFLRKVVGIEKKGKETTLVTTKAELADWIHVGKIDFSSKRSLLTGKTQKDTGVTTRSLHFLADDKQAGGGASEASAKMDAKIGDSISITNASITMKASFDGYFEIRRKDIRFLPDPPDGAAFKAVLTLDPSVAADLTWTIKNEASITQEWKGADVLIPIAAPIPLTVRYAPAVKCNISASGEAGFTVGANVGAHAVVGFQGDAGFDHFDTTNLSEAPSFTGALALKSVQGKATVSTECELVGVPELLAFDAVGMSGRLGPYASLTATACANVNAGGASAGFTLAEEHGITETFSGRVQIPLLGAGKDFELWSGKQAFGGGPTYLAGDEKTCEAPLYDSCSGKSDGFHCSEVDAFSGIVCKNGQILKGIQCADPSLTCTGGSESAIQCQ
ncbi:MAG: hypothetical protein U0270_43430 [Labilithrix sp.]